MVSADLQWQILRKHSAFTVKQRGINKTFSRDPLNLKNIHSYRYSGLIHKRAIGLHAAADGKGVTITYKKRKGQTKPNKALNKLTLSKDSRRTIRTVAGLVKSYKPPMKKLAMRRASRILQSQKPVVPRKTRVPRKKKT